MISIATLSAAAAALLATGAGAAKAAPAPIQGSFFTEGADPFRWTNQTPIDARPNGRGGFGSAGFYYGDYKGRKLEIKEILVGFGFTPTISAWYARQGVLLKGRAVTSRFDFDADSFGVRWVVEPPKEDKENSLALEFEYLNPEDASARTSNSSATYVGTKNYRLALTAGLRGGLQAQAGYSRIEGVNGERADVMSLVAAKDFDLSTRLVLRAQGHLIGQRISGSVEDVNLEVKPVAFIALGYRLANGLRLESDVTFMPSGTPLAMGRLSGLTSFQIYQPSGPAAGLRRDAFAVSSIRLVYQKGF